AFPGPRFTDLDLATDNGLIAEVLQVTPGGARRAEARFKHRLSELVYFDAVLEGSRVTLPEVVTLLEGRPIRGRTDEQIQQVFDFKAAAEQVVELSRTGPIRPTLETFNSLHAGLMAHNPGVAGLFRGDRARPGDGPLVTLDAGEVFHTAPDGRVHAIFSDGLERIADIANPVIRATTLAGWATYHQFYRDGNKRVGRYVMNAVLISEGYDAILVPASDKEDYENALLGMYRSGRVQPYTSYLLGLWLRDQH
ncbi:MAG: Fic family protein, partial [Bifidobacteriaceae bacterium]|nr:Fic family protein [Bifidobacteriaceae bacterium]